MKCLFIVEDAESSVNGYLPWFRRLQQGRYVRLLVWWLSSRDFNLRWFPCMMETTVIHLYLALEPLILSLSAWSVGWYAFFCWHHSQIARGGIWATLLTLLLSICFTCRLVDSMLQPIIAAIYRNQISGYSWCLNFWNGTCAHLCIIDVSRD